MVVQAPKMLHDRFIIRSFLHKSHERLLHFRAESTALCRVPKRGRTEEREVGVLQRRARGEVARRQDSCTDLSFAAEQTRRSG